MYRRVRPVVVRLVVLRLARCLRERTTMQSIQLATLDVEGLRTRLRKMSDKELQKKVGKAARYMVSPRATMGKPPLPTFVLQLEEARAEWRRRHPAESDEKQNSLDDSQKRCPQSGR